MNDVMLDLETMSTGPRAAIVAIGAVAFDLEAGTVGDRFYQPVDLATSVAMGGEMDASTVLWWMQQGDEARAAFAKGGVHLSKALMDFSVWLHERGAPDNVRVWGDGAAFDNVILASAYRSAMQIQPWRWWNDRCYRTAKALIPGSKTSRIGTLHNAVDDAESQARHLVALVQGQRTPAALDELRQVLRMVDDNVEANLPTRARKDRECTSRTLPPLWVRLSAQLGLHPKRSSACRPAGQRCAST